MSILKCNVGTKYEIKKLTQYILFNSCNKMSISLNLELFRTY